MLDSYFFCLIGGVIISLIGTQLAQNVKIINSKSIKSLSISTNLWGNLHTFDNCKPINDKEFLNTWFPDSTELMEWEKIKLTNKELGEWNVQDV